MLKAANLKDVQSFEPEKKLTRVVYLRRTLLLIFILVLTHFLYAIISLHDTTVVIKWTIEILIGGILLIWVLTSKVIKQIQLNYSERKFKVNYLTLFNVDKKLEVHFDFLSYKFNKKPNLRQPGKWLLEIFDKKRRVFTIETNKDGFSQETLESIVRNLQEIQLETTS